MTTAFRVMHLRASRFVGGPERQILRYANLSTSAGVTNVIATFVGDGEGAALIDAARCRGTPTLGLPSGTLAALAALIRSLRADPVSLLCTHGYKADILGILAGRLTGTPVASFLRGWTAEDAKVRTYERVNRWLLPLTSRIICLSESQRAGMGATAKIRVVTNAIESPRFMMSVEDTRAELRRRLNVPSGSQVVASAGRLSPEKGTVFFVEAANMLQSEFPQTYFAIFGDGALRSILEEQARGNVNIKFAGHLTDFPDLVRGVDLLVNPSITEEMPNVVLEAMVAGVPVVATAVGGVPEMAGTPPSLCLVPAGDASAMAHEIGRLLRDPEASRRLGSSGLHRVEQAYSSERQKEQLFHLLEEFNPRAIAFPPLPEEPFISIVVPVRNEEKHLGEVLKQLSEQDYPSRRFEVIVADGNSTDGTRDIVNTAARQSRVSIRLLENPRQLSSAGRNAGLLSSRGDIVAFIDGHCHIPSPALLTTIVALFQETGAACLCRPQPLHAQGNTPFQTALAHTRATVIGHGRDSTIFDMERERFVDPSSSGAIYRREVFETIGIYDEDFDACEDVEFNFRVRQAGLTAFSSPRIAVHYSPRTSLGGLWKQLTRYGRGRYRFIRKHREAATLAQLVPPAFILWLLALALVAPFSLWGLRAFAATLMVYGSVILAFAIRLGFRYGWHHLWISPAVYMCIHGGLGTGLWREALFGRKRKPGAPTIQRLDRRAPQMTTNAQHPGPEAWTSATSNKR